ncbi:hypothetical protein [Paenibacillus sp. GP183]|jgi:hypothetical protein|uniref:hypothetical protein n=1 Tax=Paenibacillus sp. GP183 TaxID=1882751 RepID=UPI0008996900|nr:hypothetical protein [Paenibacillus sp. GP183]SED09640.1 hypothetical protein SAMN05443246_5690 [Paenibacillus sp. GP183]
MTILDSLLREYHLNEIFESNCYALSIKGSRVFVRSWNGEEDAGSQLIKQIDDMLVKELVTALEKLALRKI